MAVVWRHAALLDREAIYDYIAADNPQAAAALDSLFVEKIAMLKRFPQMGRPGRVSGTRELLVHDHYRVVYDQAGANIRILRLLHVARQWPPRHS